MATRTPQRTSSPMWHLLVPHALLLDDVCAALATIMTAPGNHAVRVDAGVPLEGWPVPLKAHGDGWARWGRSAPSSALCRLAKIGWTEVRFPESPHRLSRKGRIPPPEASVWTYTPEGDWIERDMPLDEAVAQGWLRRSYRHMDGASKHAVLAAIQEAEGNGDPIVRCIEIGRNDL